MNAGQLNETEHGMCLIQNGFVTQKNNVVPEMERRNTRPEFQVEHHFVVCFSEYESHVAFLNRNMVPPSRTNTVPPRDKIRRPGTRTRAVASLSGTKTVKLATQDDTGLPPGAADRPES